MDYPKFKTKTGYCHIFSDKIILSRDGVVGEISKMVVGNKLARIKILYTIIAIYFGYISVEASMNSNTFPSIIYGVLAIGILLSLFNGLKYSATPVIDRNSIIKVEFKQGIKIYYSFQVCCYF
jgi:hypothetical protein